MKGEVKLMGVFDMARFDGDESRAMYYFFSDKPDERYKEAYIDGNFMVVLCSDGRYRFREKDGSLSKDSYPEGPACAIGDVITVPTGVDEDGEYVYSFRDKDGNVGREKYSEIEYAHKGGDWEVTSLNGRFQVFLSEADVHKTLQKQNRQAER